MAFPFLLMGLTTYVSNALLYHYMIKEVCNADASLSEPSFLTSIILPTFNEVDYLESTLVSLQAQNIMLAYPSKFELIIIDAESTDGTQDLIKKYADTLISVVGEPRGKLTQRHLATEQAKGEIIVAVDADTLYPSNWLNLLIRHFQNPNVVAVTAPFLFPHPNTMFSIGFAVNSIFMRHMTGCNSAYRKSSYYEAGGFNLNVDQSGMIASALEEELGFQRRLRRLGEVIYDLQAPVFTAHRISRFQIKPLCSSWRKWI